MLREDPVRLILSGPGLIGRKHIELIAANPDAQLVAIVAPEREQHIALAAELGLRLYSDVPSAIEAEEPDGAIIASPNALHAEQVLACIERGVPTLVEKPLAASVGDAGSIVTACEQGKVAVLVGHHRTYSPLLGAARAFISSEAFGNLVAVQGSALFYKPDNYFAAAPWRASKGGGPILINLIHEIGVLRFLAGEITSVAATVSSAIRRFDVEDTAAMSFSFANGAVGTFLLSDAAASSKSWEMTVGENPAYPHHSGENCYHLAGTMGSLDFPSLRCRTYVGQTPSWHARMKEEQLTAEASDPLALQLGHFIDVIRGRAQPLVSARDAYRNMVVVEAIMRSAESGRRVDIVEIAA